MTRSRSNLRRAMRTQRRGLTGRVALLFAVGAVLIAPQLDAPTLGLGWFALNAVGVLLDDMLARRALRRRGARFDAAGRLWLAHLGVRGVSYSAAGVIAWLTFPRGGELCFCFATVGGLIYNAMNLIDDRRAVVWSCVGFVLVLLLTPIWMATQSGQISDMMAAFAAAVFTLTSVISIRFQLDTHHAARAALRQTRQARRQAERATAAKSEFLAVMSHEIRTPLNAVVAASHLFDTPETSAAQRDNARMLRRAADTLSALANDVIDIARIEAGKMSLSPAPTDLSALLHDLARLWEPRAEEKGLAFHVELDPALPRAVALDALRLQQVISNLLSNALKFTSEGHVALRARARDGVLEIEVADTGPGVPPDKREAVFGAFDQSGVGARHGGGAGLGLSISSRIAELMGGALELESAPGAGALFRLTAPLTPTDSREPERCGCCETGPLEGARILAADDNEMNRMVLDALLTPTGCALTLVEDGATAVQAAEATRYDAILLDMQMPGMDGLEAARRIRAGGASHAAPLIAITANAFDSHRAAWREVGADGFISKPIDPDTLMEALCALICNARAA